MRLEGCSERGVTGMCLMFKKGGALGESTSLLSRCVLGAVTRAGRRQKGRNGQELLSGCPAESMRDMMAARAQTQLPPCSLCDLTLLSLSMPLLLRMQNGNN